jgi:hypothetical protein
MYVTPPFLATGGREISCDPPSALVSAVMVQLILSKVQTIVHGEACVSSAALQQVKWSACGTAEHGLADNRSAHQKIQPDTVQSVAKGDCRR